MKWVTGQRDTQFSRIPTTSFIKFDTVNYFLQSNAAEDSNLICFSKKSGNLLRSLK